MQPSLPTTVIERLQTLAGDFSAGRHDAVVAGIRPLLHSYPALAPAHKLLGSALLAPDDAQAFSNLGNALAGAARFDAAQAALRDAIRLQPTSATPCYNLGCLFF